MGGVTATPILKTSSFEVQQSLVIVGGVLVFRVGLATAETLVTVRQRRCGQGFSSGILADSTTTWCGHRLRGRRIMLSRMAFRLSETCEN